jgi:dynamin 1-like protein
MERVVGLVNKLQQICTQLGDTAGNSILVDKLSSIVVVGGQVSFSPPCLCWL